MCSETALLAPEGGETHHWSQEHSSVPVNRPLWLVLQVSCDTSTTDLVTETTLKVRTHAGDVSTCCAFAENIYVAKDKSEIRWLEGAWHWQCHWKIKKCIYADLQIFTVRICNQPNVSIVWFDVTMICWRLALADRKQRISFKVVLSPLCFTAETPTFAKIEWLSYHVWASHHVWCKFHWWHHMVESQISIQVPCLVQPALSLDHNFRRNEVCCRWPSPFQLTLPALPSQGPWD